MEFADAASDSFYNDHPDHLAFWQDRWLPEVLEFEELDYMLYSP